MPRKERPKRIKVREPKRLLILLPWFGTVRSFSSLLHPFWVRLFRIRSLEERFEERQLRKQTRSQ